MKESNIIEFKDPAASRDMLTELLRSGATRLIEAAVEQELEVFLGSYKDERLPDGRQRMVRNGYLPEREIQTGIGNVAVKMPRTADRGKEGITFSSTLLPPYLRRSQSVEEVLPWLYLKGISTNDFQESLTAMFGENAKGLSPSSIARLKSVWEQEVKDFQTRDLSRSQYVYLWVDGIHCGVRGDEESLCLLVIIGVTPEGKKELVALDDGYRESSESWRDVLRSLKERGLKKQPELAVGDGALGFWKALKEVFPDTKKQRCWQHKSLNILNLFPKAMKSKVLEALHEIWMAPSLKEAKKAVNRFEARFKDKYPKAVASLKKDEQELLTFYSFPAAHWRSLRTTNPIESVFATVRHRSKRAKGCVSRASMLGFAFKLIMSAQKRWHRLAGFEKLAQVIEGTNFIDGVEEGINDESNNLNNAKTMAV